MSSSTHHCTPGEQRLRAFIDHSAVDESHDVAPLKQHDELGHRERQLHVAAALVALAVVIILALLFL